MKSVPDRAASALPLPELPLPDPYTPPIGEPQGQLALCRQAAARLSHSIAQQAAVRLAFEAARDTYEDRRRALLLAATPHNPQRQSAEHREAALTHALEAELLAFRRARETMRAADADLEAAQVAERTEREALRCLLAVHTPI